MELTLIGDVLSDAGFCREYRPDHGAEEDDAARVRAAARGAAVLRDESPVGAGELDREDDGGDGRFRRVRGRLRLAAAAGKMAIVRRCGESDKACYIECK